MVCLYWGANTDNITITNSRIRDTFADGINMTNGSTDNLVTNNEARATGDDSFALFSATDAGGGDENGQHLREPVRDADLARGRRRRLRRLQQHLPQPVHRRHAGLLGHHDQLAELRLSRSTASAPTRRPFQNISLVRAGGHFWGSADVRGDLGVLGDQVFQGIRVSDVDIVDPTYSGIMFQTNYVGGSRRTR